MGFGDAVITVASAGPRANNLHLGVCCAEYLLVATVSPAETDQLIDMPFGGRGQKPLLRRSFQTFLASHIKKHKYTLSHKKGDTKLTAVTSSDLNQFSNFFQGRFSRKSAIKWLLIITSHVYVSLHYLVKLQCPRTSDILKLR